MTKTLSKPKPARAEKRVLATRHVAAEVKRLREEIEDLQDSLVLIEARARDTGKRYTAEEVRARLGQK